jgi:hypothetical protein
MAGDPTLAGRCGSCARFVRVRETIDQNGEVRRTGDCLLGVWPSPLYETSTCPQYIARGTVATHRPAAPRRTRARSPARPASGNDDHARHVPLELPEEILDMDAEEFREVLRDVIREELGVTDVELGGRWQGGEVVIKPGKEGTQEKRVPIEALFRKIVAVRDKLRVLEQKINGHPRLTEEDKVQMQQYITQSYGSLTTFNVLFADRADAFVGQKGDKDD